MPGMLRVDVALKEDNALHRALVDKKIRELRPAGIFVERAWAEPLPLAFTIGLTVTGSGLPSSELEALRRGVRERLTDFIAGVGPGQVIRQARLISLVLQDDRIADLSLVMRASGQPISESAWTVPTGKTVRLDGDQPFTFSTPVYEDQPAAAGVTLVYVDATVTAQQLSIPTGAVEAKVRPRMEALLGQLQPGAGLTFPDVLAALRDQAEASAAEWVVAPDKTTINLEPEGGAFVELSAAAAYTVPPATTLVLRTLRVEAPTQ